MDLTARLPRLPQPGETLVGSTSYQAPGGKGGNQAVAAARLGARVRMVARVGSDAFGQTLRGRLEEEGVDVSSVREAAAPTGLALIFVDENGQNQIAVIPGANDHVSPADLDGVPWEAGAWAVGPNEAPEAALVKAFRLARAGGGRTILNAAPARPLSPDLWALTDILVVNETEAEALSGHAVTGVPAALAAARMLQARGPGTVAVTLGAAGAVLVDGGLAWHVPALSVQAVDATAAGDAWVAALATALAAGADLRRAARFASAAGAITVTRPGAQPALPYREEVEMLTEQAPRPQPLHAST